MSEPSPDQLRILFASGREPDYIRNQMLCQALARRHLVSVATGSRHRAIMRYGKTILRAAAQMRASFDMVFVGFYGQPLMPVMRSMTRKPILLDAYLSTYDTLCFDRLWFRPNSFPGQLAFALDQWSCRWADRVLLDTQAHADYFVRTFGLSPDEISVIYVGCDESHFAAVPMLPLLPSFDVFTYTSFLRLHGVEHILYAAHALRSHPDITFTIAGSGPGLAKMRHLAEDLGLSNVRFPGWLPFSELPAHIAGANLCLGGHFSEIPKAGRVIATKTFQFLAMGRPTIVGENPANCEIMTHLQDAYMCPLADPAALATAILHLRQDPLLCRQLGEAGRELYQQRFTARAIARDLDIVLDEMLA